MINVFILWCFIDLVLKCYIIKIIGVVEKEYDVVGFCVKFCLMCGLIMIKVLYVKFFYD